jgi:hypothetical protein
MPAASTHSAKKTTFKRSLIYMAVSFWSFGPDSQSGENFRRIVPDTGSAETIAWNLALFVENVNISRRAGKQTGDDLCRNKLRPRFGCL